MKKQKITKILILMICSIIYLSQAEAWFKDKTLKKANTELGKITQLKAKPETCVDSYYKLREKTASSITLRGPITGVRFPWNKFDDVRKIYLIGSLLGTAEILYKFFPLDVKVPLHTEELTVKDAVLDILSDLSEGLEFLGAEQKLLNDIKELQDLVKKEDIKTKEKNKEIITRFESITDDVSLFLVKTFGTTDSQISNFACWSSLLKVLTAAMIAADKIGENEFRDELGNFIVDLLSYSKVYSSICDVYPNFPPAVKRNLNVIVDISEKIAQKKSDVIKYGYKILSSVVNIETALFAI